MQIYSTLLRARIKTKMNRPQSSVPLNQARNNRPSHTQCSSLFVLKTSLMTGQQPSAGPRSTLDEPATVSLHSTDAPSPASTPHFEIGASVHTVIPFVILLTDKRTYPNSSNPTSPIFLCLHFVKSISKLFHYYCRGRHCTKSALSSRPKNPQWTSVKDG